MDDDPIGPIDLKAMEAWKERNRQERLAYNRFKVQWMREHGQIIGPKQ